MKKSILTYFCILFCLETAFSQNEITVDGHWMQSQLINPASIKAQVNDDHLDISLLGRKQWADFPGSPCTYMADAAIYLYDLNTKFGIQAISDKIGYTYQRELCLIYAYNLAVGSESYLRMGLSGGFYTYNLDLSQVITEDQNTYDPAVKFIEDKDLKPNFNLGLEYINYNLTLGLSVHRIQEYFTRNNYYASNYIYGKYKYEGYTYFNLLMGSSLYLKKNLFQAELHSSLIFKNANEEETWWIGGTYRIPSECGFNAGIMLTPSLSVNYTYFYNFGSIRKNSCGTHEITLNYSVDLQRALCPTCRKLK